MIHACQIRRASNYEKYKNEFTIRSKRPSGNKTELRKIIEGWGDYFFYGFSNKDETALHSWFIGDLSVFRVWFVSELYKKGIDNNYALPWIEKENHDKSSSFFIFNITAIGDDFIKAIKTPINT